MRFLGVDFGKRRIGLALSDDTALLARPWRTIAAGPTPEASATMLADLIARLRADEDPEAGELVGLVVGLPRRLNGEDTHQTAPARFFAGHLGALTGLVVHLQDERLSSYEAESRLAEREPDWRLRKEQLDAAAAAVILQDFLDGRPRLDLDAGVDA
jgi:putative Holliday junction resolvase